MKILITAFLLACLLTVLAQDNSIETLESIATDRPDQTETPHVVPVKFFQAEAGFNIEGLRKEVSFVHPTVLWKVGILKFTELRLITETSTFRDTAGRYVTGLAPVQIGFKTALCEERNVRPKISFIAHLEIPYLSTKNLRTKYFAPNFRFTLEHSLKENVSLGYNAGMVWDGNSPYPAFIYTIANGINITDRWYFYYEFFGDFPVKGKSTHSFDGGFAFLIKDNIQIDLSGGFQLFPFNRGWYTSIGYSFRVPR